jgi:hypothetical protein
LEKRNSFFTKKNATYSINPKVNQIPTTGQAAGNRKIVILTEKMKTVLALFAHALATCEFTKKRLKKEQIVLKKTDIDF